MMHKGTRFMFKLIEAEWGKNESAIQDIIDSDNGVSPVRLQAIIWTDAVLSSVGPLGTNLYSKLKKND